jgi:PHP family Zn ribbon phosphoesterase
MAHYHNIICTTCYAERVPPARARLGYKSCMTCGDKTAKAVKHTIAPMHKSNYMLFTNMEDLKGINNKGGQHR